MSDVRRDYGTLSLTHEELDNDPFIIFAEWLDIIVKTDNYDPTAMVLSTVDSNNQVDSRVVLLKGIENKAFHFYTNYSSNKSKQIEVNNKVALNFFWPFMARQIRIKGTVEKLSSEKNDEYFSSRPRLSQIAAIASNQSEMISSRQILEDRVNTLIEKFGQASVLRPDNWGGYAVNPSEIEFWQGRDNRLHDRFLFKKNVNFEWIISRLAP